MKLRCFCRSIACIVRTRYERILAYDVQYISAKSLLAHDGNAFLRHEELSFHQDIIKEIPILFCMLFNRFRNGEASTIHNDINASKLERCKIECGFYFFLVSNIQLNGSALIPAVLFLKFILHRLESLPIKIIQDHTGAFFCKLSCDCLAYATCTSGDHRNLTRQCLWLWHPLQLCFFEQPVFDIECF